MNELGIQRIPCTLMNGVNNIHMDILYQIINHSEYHRLFSNTFPWRTISVYDYWEWYIWSSHYIDAFIVANRGNDLVYKDFLHEILAIDFALYDIYSQVICNIDIICEKNYLTKLPKNTQIMSFKRVNSKKIIQIC